VLITVLLVASLLPADALLPEGWEDVAWCPPGACLQPLGVDPRHTGAKSSFVQCFDPSTEKTSNEIWTGTKSPTKPPAGWDRAAFCGQGTSGLEELPEEYLEEVGVYGDYADAEEELTD